MSAELVLKRLELLREIVPAQAAVAILANPLRTYQIAAFVQAVCIAPRTVAVELFLPFHHVALAAVFLGWPRICRIPV
jgi:hypothetical protein